MAAETLSATRAAASFPTPANLGAGGLQIAWGTYAVAANVEDGDIFEMCKIPANATVVGGYVLSEALETNATPALDIDIGWAANGTDAADPDGLGNLGAWDDAGSVHLPEAGMYFPLAGVLMTAGPKTFSAETTIQLEANTAASTFAAGQVSIVVFYTVD